MMKMCSSNVRVYATCITYFISMFWLTYTRREMTMDSVEVRMAMVRPDWSCSAPLACASFSKLRLEKSKMSHTSEKIWRKNSMG